VGWRLLTCHWVHLSGDHLFWSAMIFLGLGSLCELMDKKKYYVTVAHLVGAAVGTGIGLLKDSVITGRSAVSDCHPRIQQAPVDTAGNQ
jgi:hypothetical protein